jgi:Xaa-Pro aminopeptidase
MNAVPYGLAEPDGIRPIESFPEWLEASMKLRELAERYNVAAGKLRTFQDGCADAGLVCGQSLICEVGDLCDAVVRQQAFLYDIEVQCTTEIARQAEPSYQAMMERIQESARNLSEALEEESRFRRMLERQRVATGSLPGVPSRVRREVRSLRRLPGSLPGCLTAFVNPRRGGGSKISGPKENRPHG